jgi:hypothetical protein
MKRARHAGPIAILVLMMSGCASAPPPLPPDQIPAPPPVYGSDPYQTGTANATLPVGGVLTGTGGQVGGTAMTQEQASAWIKDAIDKKSEELAKGFTLEGEIASDKVTAAAEKKFAVTGVKGTCLRMIAVADPGITKLDTYLYDGDKLLDRDIGEDTFPVVSTCFKSEKEIKLIIKVDEGSGWFVVRVFSKDNDGTVKTTMEAVEKKK